MKDNIYSLTLVILVIPLSSRTSTLGHRIIGPHDFPGGALLTRTSDDEDAACSGDSDAGSPKRTVNKGVAFVEMFCGRAISILDLSDFLRRNLLTWASGVAMMMTKKGLFSYSVVHRESICATLIFTILFIGLLPIRDWPFTALRAPGSGRTWLFLGEFYQKYLFLDEFVKSFG